jgi:hypothetical protein
VFGWRWGWGWGAHVNAMIDVLDTAGCVVRFVERCTRFLALSMGHFVLLPTISEVYLNLNRTHLVESLICIA